MSDTFIPFEPSYSVDEFARRERICRVKLYDYWTADAAASHTRRGLTGSGNAKPRPQGWRFPMRRPPDSRKARAGIPGLGNDTKRESWKPRLDSRFACPHQEPRMEARP
jgi:hypothetical protein